MATPPTSVSPNEENPPSRAQARAAMTMRVSESTCRPVIGTTRMPATAASAPPSAQLTVASRSGDQPSDAADTSSSAAATTARPNRVKR